MSPRGVSVQPGKESLQVRERHYNYPLTNKDTLLFDSDNPILTFEWYAFQLLIPPGERFFIRSAQRLAHLAQSPALKKQLKGFIGQEAAHAKETERFLEPLSVMGFPVKKFENWFEGIIHKMEGFFNWPLAKLAVTAGIEHYTTVWAIWHLSCDYVERFPFPYRDFFQWHAAEELEHKAIAFNLLQELAPRNYILRSLGFIVGMGIVAHAYRRALKFLYQYSGISQIQLKKAHKKARRVRIPLLSWRFPLLWKYLRPGFHPNQIDDGELGKVALARQENISTSIDGAS